MTHTTIAATLLLACGPALHGAPIPELALTDHETLDITLPGALTQRLVVPFAFRGESYTMLLDTHSVRSDTFRISVHDNGAIRTITPPPVRTYRGHLLENPAAIVTALAGASGFTARVHFDDAPAWAIEPHAGGHIIYSATDLAPQDVACSEIVLDDDAERPVPTPRTTTGVRGGFPLYIAQIGWDVDYDAFQDLGSVSACIERVELTTLDVNVIYERDVDITHTIEHIIVRTDPLGNPFTSNTDVVMLQELSVAWNSPPLNQYERDMVHLLTGRDINNNNVIGVAYVDRTCSQSAGMGASEVRPNLLSQTGLVAHELGHNWSARHCNAESQCNIMCSGIGGCSGLGLPNFSPQPIADILSKRDSVTCLDIDTGPINACLADFDSDGDVDLGDFGAFGIAFDTTPASPNYNPDADFDNDGDVDLGDFGAFGTEFGRLDCLN